MNLSPHISAFLLTVFKIRHIKKQSKINHSRERGGEKQERGKSSRLKSAWLSSETGQPWSQRRRERFVIRR